MSIYGISENLYRLDENIEPQPWIAESVETPDENTWVFTIRDGVTFSNGKTVDAKAVKACFERTYEKNERADSTLKIKSMEADGMKFTIVTPEPNPTLLNDLCDPLLGIYDATEEPDEELGVSCTGPYVATSFTAMTDVKMRANENYWGGAPKADTVELKIIDDQDALDMALHQRKPKSVIHHSDQGCQYTSIAFGLRCKEMKVRPSMGSVGDCFDNAMCEPTTHRNWALSVVQAEQHYGTV